MKNVIVWFATTIGGCAVLVILGTSLVEPAAGPDAMSRPLKWALRNGAVPLAFSGAWMIYGFAAVKIDWRLAMVAGLILSLWGWGLAAIPKGFPLGMTAVAIGTGLLMLADVRFRVGP